MSTIGRCFFLRFTAYFHAVLKTPYLVAEPPPTCAAVLVFIKYSLFAYVCRECGEYKTFWGIIPPTTSGFQLPAIAISVIAVLNYRHTSFEDMPATPESLLCTIPFVSLKDDATYSAALQRMYEVTACKEWEKLAEFLGVRLSILSDARRRKRVPPEILLTLLFKLSVNPAWVLTGEGAKFLQPTDISNRHV